jgi:hypothetical protein
MREVGRIQGVKYSNLGAYLPAASVVNECSANTILINDTDKTYKEPIWLLMPFSA